MRAEQWTNSEIDKSKWGEGPWIDEPDKVQWVDHFTGMPCLAVRHPHLGFWCGYVGVNRSHALYREHYAFPRGMNVHGGLTFARSCQEGMRPCEGVCHVPEPGEPDKLWWFGFDCGHAWDMEPGMRGLVPPSVFDAAFERLGKQYRDLGFVRKECAVLAAQLRDYGWGDYVLELLRKWAWACRLKINRWLGRRRLFKREVSSGK